MSGVDEAKNKAQDLGGKAKEAVGKVTGDKSTEHRGQRPSGEVQPQRRRREGQGRLQELSRPASSV